MTVRLTDHALTRAAERLASEGDTGANMHQTYDPMPTRNRAERRKRARHHRRAHGAWRAAVHREALLTERAWARTHGAWKRSDCWFRRRQWLAERMYDAWQAKRALPPRPHFQTLSAWMAAQR